MKATVLSQSRETAAIVSHLFSSFAALERPPQFRRYNGLWQHAAEWISIRYLKWFSLKVYLEGKKKKVYIHSPCYSRTPPETSIHIYSGSNGAGQRYLGIVVEIKLCKQLRKKKKWYKCLIHWMVKCLHENYPAEKEHTM